MSRRGSQEEDELLDIFYGDLTNIRGGGIAEVIATMRAKTRFKKKTQSQSQSQTKNPATTRDSPNLTPGVIFEIAHKLEPAERGKLMFLNKCFAQVFSQNNIRNTQREYMLRVLTDTWTEILTTVMKEYSLYFKFVNKNTDTFF